MQGLFVGRIPKCIDGSMQSQAKGERDDGDGESLIGLGNRSWIRDPRGLRYSRLMEQAWSVSELLLEHAYLGLELGKRQSERPGGNEKRRKCMALLHDNRKTV